MGEKSLKVVCQFEQKKKRTQTTALARATKFQHGNWIWQTAQGRGEGVNGAVKDRGGVRGAEKTVDAQSGGGKKVARRDRQEKGEYASGKRTGNQGKICTRTKGKKPLWPKGWEGRKERRPTTSDSWQMKTLKKREGKDTGREQKTCNKKTPLRKDSEVGKWRTIGPKGSKGPVSVFVYSNLRRHVRVAVKFKTNDRKKRGRTKSEKKKKKLHWRNK